MKLQPESKKELTRIACGTAICTAALWVAFAALHLATKRRLSIQN